MRKFDTDQTNWANEAYHFVSGILNDTRDAHDLDALSLEERQPETNEGDLLNTFEQLAERFTIS